MSRSRDDHRGNGPAGQAADDAADATPAAFRVRTRFRRGVTAVGATVVICGGLLAATATPALASHGNPEVTVSGHVSCGALESVDSVQYRTDNGESGSADISESDLNQVATKIVGREIPGLGFIKAETYSVTLENVPSGGTTLYLDVSCSNVLGSGGYSTYFGVRRPLFGTSATRHVCDPEVIEVVGCTI